MKKKNSAIISMLKPVFVKEHKELVKILRTGTRKERLKEASSQEKELYGR